MNNNFLSMKKQTEKIQLTVEDEGKDQRIDKYISSILTQFQDHRLNLG